MAKINRRSVGAGKDHSDLTSVSNYIAGRDLVALDEILIFDVYDNSTRSHITFQLGNTDKDHYCVIQPAPGRGWKDLRSANDPLTYEGAGVELAFANVAFYAGIKLRGFMIKQTASSYNGMIVGRGTVPTGLPVEVSGCLLLSSSVGNTGQHLMSVSAIDGTIHDNVLFATTVQKLIYMTYGSHILRNTFIKRASSTAPCALDCRASGAGSIKDNVFVGFGNEPILATTLSPAVNNYTDTVGINNSAGLTVVSGTNGLIRGIDDARPTLGSPIIGTSVTGVGEIDARGLYRGTTADVGAVEAVASALPAVPVLTITDRSLDAITRQLTITGTTTGNPVFGTATLTTSDSTVTHVRALAFDGNKFTAIFDSVPIGSYKAPVIVAENYGGTSAAASNAVAFTVNPPPVPVATVTSTQIYGRSMTIAGTVTNAAETGTVSIAPASSNPNGAVAKNNLALTITGGTFTVTIDNITPGNYAAPTVLCANASGNGNPATGVAAFTVLTPAIPTAVITEQVRIGARLYIAGTFTKFPDTATARVVANTTSSTPGTTTTPVAVALDKQAGTFSVSLVDIGPGDYNAPNITFTNEAGNGTATGGQAVTIVSQVPTPIPGAIIVTIGAGKEYSTLANFGAWLRTQDLVALNQMVYAYVYDDVVDPSTKLYVGQASDSCYCIIMPAPGLSVWEVENPTGPLTYGKYGLEMVLSINRGLWVGSGVQLTGFRIRVPAVDGATGGVTDTGAILSSVYLQPASNTYRSSIFNRNRVLIENTSATPFFALAGSSSPSPQVEDNVFFHKSGGTALDIPGRCKIRRNTFIRVAGSGADVKAIRTGSSSTEIDDNVITGYSTSAVVETSALSGKYTNNYSSNDITPALTGFFVEKVKQFVVSDVDARPAAGGALIGMGSPNTVGVNDVRSRNRGAVPDVGAVQLAYVMPLPYGSITSQVLDAQRVTITGTTTNTPTSGTVTILPGATPAGAVQQGPIDVTFSGNTFTVVIDNIPAGNYAAPIVRLVNSGGIGSPLPGSSTFVIQSITGTPQAVMNKPEVTIDNISLANGIVTATGTVDLHGDIDGVLTVYLDPTVTGTALGPYVPVVTGKTWTFTSPSTVSGGYSLRAVATLGDGQTTTVSSNQISSTLVSTGVIRLPRHGQTAVAPPSLRIKPTTRFDATTQGEYDAAITSASTGSKRVAAAYALRNAFLNGHRLSIYQSGHTIVTIDLVGDCTVVDDGTDVYFQPSSVVSSAVIKTGDLATGDWWFELEGNTGFTRFLCGSVGGPDSSAELVLPENPDPNQGIVPNMKFVIPRSIDNLA